jgi:cytochrome c oxidase subunit IV
MSETVILGSLLYSHIIPPILAFVGVLLLCSGIMDRKMNYTLIGMALFFAAGILPFLILPAVLG